MAPTKNRLTLEEKLINVENQINSDVIRECLNAGKFTNLLKAFREKDQSTLQAILSIDEDSIIRVVQRLPNAIIEELIVLVRNCLHETAIPNGLGSLWLKHLLKTNAIYLMSQPNIEEVLNPIANLIEQRIAFQNSLRGLQGNINFFLNQLHKRNSDVIENDEILMADERDVDDSSSEEFCMNESPKDDSSDEDEDI